MKIEIPNGTMKCVATKEILKKTQCFKCKQDIYIVYTAIGLKLAVDKVGDKLISHEMRCPHSQLSKTERTRLKQQKEYEERINKKDWARKVQKKNRR